MGWRFAEEVRWKDEGSEERWGEGRRHVEERGRGKN